MTGITYKCADVKWDMHDGYGNHRFIVNAPSAEYVSARLPWRRRDEHPDLIGIRIRYGNRENGVGTCETCDIIISSCTRDEGDIIFRAPQSGEYEIYYMPYLMPGEWYAPDIEYFLAGDMTPDAVWKKAYDKSKAIPAEVVSYESRAAFDSFYPMEMPMTDTEKENFLNADAPFTSLIESRLTPIRMKHALPFVWCDRADRLSLSDSACSNEHYAFQLAICAKEKLTNIKVSFTDSKGREYPLNDVICFNLNGVDADGKEMVITRDADAGEVVTLWCGVKCECFDGDNVKIYATVTADGTDYSETCILDLTLIPDTLPRNGDDELWRMSRLFWLNDTIGSGYDTIAPYTPVKVDEASKTVDILGRQFKVGTLGLPDSAISFFDDRCTLDGDTEPIELFRSPVTLNVKENGTPKNIAETEQIWHHDGTLRSRCITEAVCGSLKLLSTAAYESDGNVDVTVNVTATADGEYEFDLSLLFNSNAVPYMMGMCREGGTVPSSFVYYWDEKYDGNEVWLGGARAGVQLKLMQENEHWHGAKPLPRMWANGGLGCIRLKNNPNTGEVALNCLTGKVKLEKGQTEILHFHLIFTPFHPIDYKKHFTHHYYHKNPWNSTEHIPNIERAKEMDADTIILHQGSPINENINYPFIRADDIKVEVEKAHSMGLKYKLYYTVRELSNYTAELWALMSLGDEIFKMDGDFRIADYFVRDGKVEERPDGGPWLVEHLVEGFTPAWHQFLESGELDCAIATTPKSRWHNYYLKGLGWLARVVGIDGIYLDGIGYDRHIMRRVRRILDAAKPGVGDIDIHCGNEHNPAYGNGISSCIYLEHFAYADSIWNGEGFDCQNSSPENFLTEMCGIPFGVMGEMLESGGNPWRGMLYGMTARCGWSQGGVSTTIWRSVWEKFGIADAKMYGYWHPDCPVSVDNDEVKATVYVKDNGDVLICLASWFPYAREFRLSIDRNALGITGNFELYAPEIGGMRPTDRRIPLEGVDMSSPVGNLQEEAVFDGNAPLYICPGKGYLLFLRRK